MAAAVFTVLSGPNSMGDRWVTVVKLVGPSSYSAGGVTVAPADVGLGFVDGILSGGTNTAAATYSAEYNATTKKVIFYAGTSQASGDTSTYIFYLICFGT